MVRNGIARVLRVFAEPERRILDPLHMLVRLLRHGKVKVGVDMPREKITGIAPKEIGVGVARHLEQRGRDVLRYPPDLRIEEFRDDVRLAPRLVERSVGQFAGLEPLPDEKSRGNLVGAAGRHENNREAAAVGMEMTTGRRRIPCRIGRITIAAIGPEIIENPRAISGGRFIGGAPQPG